ncbi:hypothetical protein [Globicatella sanguinis]
MELKDILPFLDPEVLKRWTEYQSKLDWSLMEDGKRYAIEQLSEFIRTKGYGGDVRESIAQAIEWIDDLTNKQILNEEQTQKLAEALLNDFKSLNSDVENFESSLLSSFAAFKSQIETEKDTIIANATQDSEVISARGGKATLGQRLDETDAQKVRIKNGKIKLPSDFPKLPFDIFKVGDWAFTHNATPQNQHDWSTATEVFIAGFGAKPQKLGTSASSPITLETFHANVTNGLYGSQDDFILTFTNTYYTIYTYVDLGSLHKNLYFRSASLKGKTYISQFQLQGSGAVSQPWVADGDIFKTTVTASTDNVPINTGAGEDEFGISNPHIPVASVSEVRNLVGAYYYDLATKTMYLNPYPEESISDVELFEKTRSRFIDITNTSNNLIIFENLHFINGAYQFRPSTVDTKLYFFGCKFYRGLQDAFAITGEFTVYLLDCVGAYPNKDAFNYHTTSTDSLAVEINGRGYGAGQYKYIGEGNQGQSSNNGSTAHDGMYMLRVGGEYWDCEGPVIADVFNCYSISIGCRTFDILPTTTTKILSGLYVQNEEGTTLEEEKPKYFIECEQHGKYFTRGVVATRSNKTFVQGVNADISEAIEIDWEDII